MALVGVFVLPMDRLAVEIDIDAEIGVGVNVNVSNEGISNESSLINGVVLFEAEEDKALFMFMFMFVFIALLLKEFSLSL